MRDVDPTHRLVRDALRELVLQAMWRRQSEHGQWCACEGCKLFSVALFRAEKALEAEDEKGEEP